MSSRKQIHALRSIQLQAVDGLGEPIPKASFELHIDGKHTVTAYKKTPQAIDLKFKRTDGEVVLIAIVDGHEPIKKRISPGVTACKFTFKGGGQPLVLVVCALAIEAAAVRATCDRVDKGIAGLPGDRAIYDIGHYSAGAEKSPRKILIATSGMGNIKASALTTNALRSFDGVKHILMVGIAGGCPKPAEASEHVRLGDVVVADAKGIVEYDNIKVTEDEVTRRAHPQVPSFEMLQAASSLDSGLELGERPWEAWIKRGLKRMKSAKRPAATTDILKIDEKKVAHPKDPLRRPGQPRIHRGAVASSNTLLKSPKIRDEIRDRWSVRAVEMEGSGVQGAAWALGRDVMIVRGICDYCDVHKTDTWQRYAALAAAAYARTLIEALPEAWFP